MLTERADVDKISYVSTERWSSWFKAPVLKTGVPLRVPWVRIPLSPPFFLSKNKMV